MVEGPDSFSAFLKVNERSDIAMIEREVRVHKGKYFWESVDIVGVDEVSADH